MSKELTEFAQSIFDYLETNTQSGWASRWEIAQNAFPEKWKRRQGRAAIIGHIDRVAIKHEDIFYRLPAKDQWDDAVIGII